MGKCTKCGYPNEYVDGPYLCHQCKLFMGVFCGEQAQVSVSKPEPRPKTERVSPWANMTPDERNRAADKFGANRAICNGEKCLNCGKPWGDHRVDDWHCPIPPWNSSFSDTQWFVEIPF